MIVPGTTRTLIRGVAGAWRRQYGAMPTNPKWAEILTRLDALDKETATPDEVEAIIGNRSWTRMTCDGCDREVTEWVRIGDDPDYESSTVHVCGTCLSAATEALQSFTATTTAPAVVSESLPSVSPGKDTPDGG